MQQILIFGGTTEGRRITECLAVRGLSLLVCVATEYGAGLLPQNECVNVHVGRMDETEILAFIQKHKPCCCVDATHPYAVEVTNNVIQACEKTGVKYLRVMRKEGDNPIQNNTKYHDCMQVHFCDSVATAAAFLETTTGKILVTTGSKELEEYTAITGFKERVVARVLPTVSVLEKCKSLGFEGRNLICMQGPFSESFNYECLRSVDAKWLVTKCSGDTGGYAEKCDAAIRAGVGLVLIGRPEEQADAMSVEQAVQCVLQMCSRKEEFEPTIARRTIYMIGAGPGGAAMLTGEAATAIRACDLLIGAGRMLDACDAEKTKEHYISYKAEEILQYIDHHTEYQTTGILYSGDIGFYSGATKLTELLKNRAKEEEAYEVIRVSGISSPLYMLDRLGIPWQNVLLLSNHGCRNNLVGEVLSHEKVCTLIGDGDTVSDICKKLIRYGMKHVMITVGERLSYADECIMTGTLEQFAGRQTDSLAVVLFENEHPIRCLQASISDEEFIRGKVPMTKRDIRTLSIDKLHLTEKSIVYDVGAGTGAMSVALARAASDGCVYAIETDEKAIALIEENRTKFVADNINIVSGMAPEALETLPAPTHVFIGGSKGNLIEIIHAIRKKNKDTRFVVNAVTVETIAKLCELAKEIPAYADMELLHVQLARSKVLGSHHLMSAENGICIASFGG
ncbi:MAG: precorrin-6A reductase [Lachnospiraceae bacterium]|nr:precorrin-6A reductase [Lachnospiraceae bacterium]